MLFIFPSRVHDIHPRVAIAQLPPRDTNGALWKTSKCLELSFYSISRSNVFKCRLETTSTRNGLL